jgi:membrane-associated phospholipid phosphatase
MDVFAWIEEADKNLFSFIHYDASFEGIDWLMLGMREAFTWIPLYAFMLFWILKYHRRYAWQFILLTICTFAITDFTSASVFKPMLSRLRPCYDPDLQSIIRNLVGCGGQNSMPSSHAANHFGLATFWFLSIQRMTQRNWHWLWLWAFMIGYAQIYVGKHYPLDIMLGAFLGVLVGLITGKFFEEWLFYPKDSSTVQVPDLQLNRES